jgi:hypothetical protein
MIDKLKSAMDDLSHPDYEQLPESIKMIHSPAGFAWLGTERNMVIERETMPDWDVVE